MKGPVHHAPTYFEERGIPFSQDGTFEVSGSTLDRLEETVAIFVRFSLRYRPADALSIRMSALDGGKWEKFLIFKAPDGEREVLRLTMGTDCISGKFQPIALE